MINIQSPNNRKELRRFIGMINFYRDMWRKRAEVLAPLTALCSTKVKFEWTLKHEKAFKEIKQIITKEVMLSYPDFNKPFEIYTDASQVQLGSVISQENRPIAFYSRKLSPAQTRYTTIEKELLAIVETLKEYKNILLGQKIKIYTDHMNLTYKKYTSDRVMRWRLIIEEFGPELIYVQGQKNIIADSLSRLAIAESATQEITYEQLLMQNAETFAQEKESLPRNIYPLNFKLIAQEQSLDEELLAAAERNVTGNYQLKDFRGGGKTIQMLCYLDKIVIPKSLQLRTVEWYHTSLCHPGLSRTEETIKQNLIWKHLRQTVREVCKKCSTCQRTKKSSTKYGKLPAKEAEANPWEKLCVDLIGPYTIQKGNKKSKLWCLTMIDPATGWFEVNTLARKDTGTTANIVEQTWLTRYPWPQEIIYDRGKEFMGDFAKMICKDYGIKRRPITTRNP